MFNEADEIRRCPRGLCAVRQEMLADRAKMRYAEGQISREHLMGESGHVAPPRWRRLLRRIVKRSTQWWMMLWFFRNRREWFAVLAGWKGSHQPGRVEW